MNYYDKIKEKLLKNEIYAKVKDYSKERNKVLTYFEVGKKNNRRTLYNMRKFYEIFNSEKLYPLGSILLSSHYREFLSLKNIIEELYLE